MISIYVPHFNRLELLESQYSKLKKHCKDDIFTYNVINNGIDQNTRDQIKVFCKNNNLNEIEIHNNDKIAMTAMNHKFALQYCYDNYISKDKSDVRVVMDADIIPFKNFKFLEILGDNQIAGIRMDIGADYYIASFISIYRKDVDLKLDLGKDMEFDSGLGTSFLVKKYKTKFIDHTAPIRKEESDYIFKNKLEGSLPYDENFVIQFIAGCFLHHYRGSGWDNGDPNYYARKKQFITSFLENPNLYNPILDSIVHYDHAHMEQWVGKDKYPLYQIIKKYD